MIPTVVLLHGVGLDHRMWEPVTDALGESFRVVTPDLLGHGAKPPAPSATSLFDMAESVADEIPDGAHVVGFSLGALVAQRIAIDSPGRIASVTSVASVCRRTDSERQAVLARLEVARADYAASTAASLKRWYDGTAVTDRWVEWTRDTLSRNDIESFLNCYEVFATGDAEIAPRLSEISAPSLAVTGANDPGSIPDMSYRLAEAIPGCRVVIVERARHMLPVERPAELAETLIEFIGGSQNVRA